MSFQIWCPLAAIRLVCDIPEDTARRGHTIIIFIIFAGLLVSNFFNCRADVKFASRRRGVPWRKPLKLSNCAYWYHIILLPKQEHGVRCNSCPWLLEHVRIGNTTSWVAAHNLSCSHRSVMELNMTTRMNNPNKHSL